MEDVSPYAVMRNSATLSAYRARLRAGHKAGQIFFTLYLLCAIPGLTGFGLMFGLGLGGRTWPWRNDIELASTILFVIGGVCGLIGATRCKRYLKDHPFDPKATAPQ